MTQKSLAIQLKINADTRDGQALLTSFSKQLDRLPAEAKTASSGLKTAFQSIRADLNAAFTFSAGQLLADGLQSGVQAVKDFGADAVRTFLDVEEVMTGVAKTTGLPQAEIDKLNTSLRNTAAAIGPITTAQLGAVAEVAGQLGIASDKIQAGNFAAARAEIEGFSLAIGEAAIALPEFTGGAEEIADASAKVLNLYGLASDSVDTVLSVANELANTTAADAKQIFGFLEGFTSANSLGILNEQAQAIGATFVSLGQDPHDAATRFQSALDTLNAKGVTDAAGVIAKSETAIQKLAEMSNTSVASLQSEEAIAKALTEAMNSDIAGAALLVGEAVGDLDSKTGKLDAANEIFGKVGARIMMTMAENVEQYETNLSTAIQASENAKQGLSSIHQEFLVAVSTQGAKFAELNSQVTAVKEVIGKDLVTALGNAVETDITPMVEGFRTWLETSKEAENLFKVVIPGAISLTSQALHGVGTAAVGAFNGIASSAQWLGETIASAQMAFQDMPSLGESAEQSFEAIVSGAQNAVTTITTSFAGSPFEPFITAAGGAANRIIEEYGLIADTSVSTIAAIADGDIAGAYETAFTGVTDLISLKLDGAAALFNGFAPNFSGVLSSASEQFGGLSETIAGYFAEMERSPQGFKAAVVASLTEISQVTSDTMEGVGGIVKESLLEICEHPEILTDTYQLIWTGIQDGANTAWTGIQDAANAAWDGIKTGAGIAWDTVTLTFADVATIFSPFVDTAEKTITGLQDLFGALWEGLKDGPKELLHAFDGLREGVADKLSGLLDLVPGPVQKLLGIEGTLEPVELSVDAGAALDSLKALNTEYQILGSGSRQLQSEFYDLAGGLKTAMADGVPVSQALIDQFEAMRAKIEEVGVEAYGHSTFPDMDAAIQQTVGESERLTAELEGMREETAELGAAYDAASVQVKTKQRAIQELEIEIRTLSLAERNASKAEREGIKQALVDLRNKKDALRIEVASLKLVESSAKDAYDTQVDLLQDVEREEQAVAKTRAALIKDLEQAEREHQRTVEQAIAEEQRLYAGLDEQTQAYLYTQEDATAALAAAGFEITEYTQAALDQAKAEYEAAQATEAASEALDEMAASAAGAGGILAGLSGTLGTLSGSISQLGDLFGFDTGGIEDFLGKAQGLAELPDMFGDVKDSLGDLLGEGGLGGLKDSLGDLFGEGGLGGLKDSLGGLLGEGGLGGVVDSLASFVPGIGSVLSALGPLKGVLGDVWDGIKSLFDAESEGQKANKHWASYISEHIEGGDQLKDAVRGQYGDMKAAGYDYMTYLDEVGASTHNVLGGFSDAWDTGSGALDRFAQAAGTASGEMKKGPQLALETIGAMQEMGMSIDEVALSMGEMTAASLGTSTELEQQAVIEDMLANSSQLSADEIAALQGALADLQGQSSSTGQTVDGTTQSLDGLGDVASVTSGDIANTAKSLNDMGGSAADAAGSLSGTAMSADELRAAAEATSNATVGAGGSLFGLGNNAQQLKDDFGVLADEVDGSVSSLGDLQRQIDEIPAQKHIQIKVDQDGAIPEFAAGGLLDTAGLIIHNELGPEIAKYPSGAMALLTAPGPALGVFPAGTEIIPHHRVNRILRDNPTIQTMATGGVVRPGAAATIIERLVIENTITGNYLSPDLDLDWLTRELSYRLEPKIRAVLRRA